MKMSRTSGRLRDAIRSCCLVCCVALIAVHAAAQAGAPDKSPVQAKHTGPASTVERADAGTIAVLMVSDIHFEPFWDPAKAVKLAAAPASEWHAILAAPASPDQAARFVAVEQGCHTRGEDTTFALFASSLRAMRAHAAGAKFVTVSGDLMSHAFDCKFDAVFPKAEKGDYSAFAAKTVEYVVDELRAMLPGVPVYAALGNNDSGCGDYKLDANSEFLAATGKALVADVPPAEQARALETFAAGGYYSVSLPSPMKNARLLVLNDIFMSRQYTTCGGTPDPAPAVEQITWLQKEIAAARANNQKLWVMSHIPPGINPYSTISKMRNICGGKAPDFFLSSDDLANALAGSGDVVQLAIFAHTHMDELRLIGAGGKDPVAMKMVASISPIDGNSPSITVARIDPADDLMKDYRVFVASNTTGIGTVWNEEYDFVKSLHEPAFSAPALEHMIAGFKADPNAATEASHNYLAHYYVRDASLALQAFWPEYVCALGNYTAESFKSCMCSGGQ